MTDLTGYVLQVFRGKAYTLLQVAEAGTAFLCDSQLGYCPGDGVRNIYGELVVRFPETVRRGETKNGLFWIVPPVVAPRTRVLFDTELSANGDYVAVNVRSV